MSELRYHPFLDQWVITATHRQNRTFHPPADFCPLCPTKPGGFPTEIPFEDYDIVVFENRFPSLQSSAPEPSIAPTWYSPVRRSEGVCEVVCYSSQHDATLATLPLSQVRKLARVWKDRYEALIARPEVSYVFIFENKGKEIGVTLSHPHGQIYGYPFIPPTMDRMLSQEHAYLEKTGRCLMGDWLDDEREESVRVVWQNEGFAAIVPLFARYPYEVWVVTKHAESTLADFSPERLDQLAEAVWTVARKYDRLFDFSMPYMMGLYQHDAPFSRFHVQFTPPYRTADKLKYLAASEAHAGAFINDTLPEDSAAILRGL